MTRHYTNPRLLLPYKFTFWDQTKLQFASFRLSTILRRGDTTRRIRRSRHRW